FGHSAERHQGDGALARLCLHPVGAVRARPRHLAAMTNVPAVELEALRPRRTSNSWHEPVSLRVETGSFVTLVTTPVLAASLFRFALGFEVPPNGVVR